MKLIYIALLGLMIIPLTSCNMKKDQEQSTAAPVDFDALWDYHDPEATEARFRALLPDAAAHWEPSKHAELLTQIARTKGLQRGFESAHALLDTVEAMLPEEGDIATVRYLLERGRVYNSSGQPDTASRFFLQAYELSAALNSDFYTVDAAHMLGISMPPEERMQWNLAALKVAEESEEPKAQQWKGSLYNNIGWTYHDEGQFREALEVFQKALQFREAQKDTNAIMIARWTVGRVQRSLGNYDSALATQKDLLADRTALSLSPDGYIYEEIGENLLALGREKEAEPFFRKAYDLLSKDAWMEANESARLERLKSLGN